MFGWKTSEPGWPGWMYIYIQTLECLSPTRWNVTRTCIGVQTCPWKNTEIPVDLNLQFCILQVGVDKCTRTWYRHPLYPVQHPVAVWWSVPQHDDPAAPNTHYTHAKTTHNLDADGRASTQDQDLGPLHTLRRLTWHVLAPRTKLRMHGAWATSIPRAPSQSIYICKCIFMLARPRDVII